MQAKHKTTLLLDPDVWRRFQEQVFRTEGPRAVSAEVEKLMAAQDPDRFAEALRLVFPAPARGFPSSEDVERGRPRIRRGGAASLIREERDERDDRVLGLKRHRETVPRRRGR